MFVSCLLLIGPASAGPGCAEGSCFRTCVQGRPGRARQGNPRSADTRAPGSGRRRRRTYGSRPFAECQRTEATVRAGRRWLQARLVAAEGTHFAVPPHGWGEGEPEVREPLEPRADDPAAGSMTGSGGTRSRLTSVPVVSAMSVNECRVPRARTRTAWAMMSWSSSTVSGRTSRSAAYVWFPAQLVSDAASTGLPPFAGCNVLTAHSQKTARWSLVEMDGRGERGSPPAGNSAPELCRGSPTPLGR